MRSRTGAPLSAQAHRAWLAPTSTVLSGNDAWVGFDAGMSNGVFIPDHAAMRLSGLTITAPDGSTAQAENVTQAKYRSSFDLHLSQPGTYRVANVGSGFMASYKQGGEQYDVVVQTDRTQRPHTQQQAGCQTRPTSPATSTRNHSTKLAETTCE